MAATIVRCNKFEFLVVDIHEKCCVRNFSESKEHLVAEIPVIAVQVWSTVKSML